MAISDYKADYLKSADVSVSLSVYEKTRINEDWNIQETELGMLETNLRLDDLPFNGWINRLSEKIQAYLSNTYPHIGQCHYCDAGWYYEGDGSDTSNFYLRLFMHDEFKIKVIIFGRVDAVRNRVFVGDPKKALLPL